MSAIYLVKPVGCKAGVHLQAFCIIQHGKEFSVKTFRSFSFCFGLCCASFAVQAADSIRPGLWEFRSTRLSVAGMPDMSSQMSQLQQQLKHLPADARRMIEQQMTQRGVSLGQDGTVRSCITPEQARHDNVYSGKVEGNCTLNQVVKSGNTVRGRLMCTDPAASGDFHARVESPEHFTSRVDLKSPRGDLEVETDARWVSAQCGPAKAVAGQHK